MEERFETFTVLITRISRSIKRIKADEMADFELKGPHVSCLYYLSQRDGMTAAEPLRALRRGQGGYLPLAGRPREKRLHHLRKRRGQAL